MEDKEIYEWIDENWEEISEAPDRILEEIIEGFGSRERKKKAKSYIYERLREEEEEYLREEGLIPEEEERPSFWERIKSGVVKFFRGIFRL